MREPWDFLSKNIGILGYFAAHIGIFKKFHLATLVAIAIDQLHDSSKFVILKINKECGWQVRSACAIVSIFQYNSVTNVNSLIDSMKHVNIDLIEYTSAYDNNGDRGTTCFEIARHLLV